MAVEPSRPGVRRCVACQKDFRSQDVERIRRCPRCKRKEDGYSPREIRVSDVRAAVHHHFRRE